jgi:hypothetical protein
MSGFSNVKMSCLAAFGGDRHGDQDAYDESPRARSLRCRYPRAGTAAQARVDHSKYEWARGDVHTNTLENFFSVFKRGLVGTYQHMDKAHLDRYLAEFDFRFNTRAKLGVNDTQRAALAVQGFKGKRLTYAAC